MTNRFKRGDKVEVISNTAGLAGLFGVIDCRPVIEMRRHFDWCVQFPDGRNFGFKEGELNFATVPQHARPLSVGALKAGSR